MAFLLCCRGPKSPSPVLVPPDEEPLRTLQPTFAASIVLPSVTAPDRSTTGIDETQALRDIFGPSPASPRGHRVAARSSGSFDANFQFGHESPTRPRTRAQWSVDRLGQNIRQRLSQSKLSNRSSRNSVKNVKSTETVIHTKELAAAGSFRDSDDLLVSRTASEGGYDSDAKGIPTPSWTKTSAGSILVSQEYTAKLLNQFHDSPRSHTSARTTGNSVNNDRSRHDTCRTPSTAGKGPAHHEQVEAVEDGCPARAREAPPPKMLASPHRESLSALLQLGPQDSPADVLRRLSVGLANGTIKLPEIPELKAIRMPSLVEAIPDWRLSFAAPQRASSLNRGDAELRRALKTLKARVENTEADIAAVEKTPDGKQLDIFSSLEPCLLQYLSRFGDEAQESQLHSAITGFAGNEDDRSSCKNASDRGMRSFASTSPAQDTTCVEAIHPEHNMDRSSFEECSQHRNTGVESEKESIHLFDMRISQRLAFTSVLPSTSPSSTNLGSDQQRLDKSSQSFRKLDRFPTFVGQTSAEHLRKPSDPGTRRLFEPDWLPDGRRSLPNWKSGISASGLDHEKPFHEPELGLDDVSSVYLSDPGVEDNDKRSIISRIAPSHSLRKPESFAVARRQDAFGLLFDQRPNSRGRTSSMDDANKRRLARGPSNVRGKESRFSENFDISKQSTGSKMTSEGADTLANEKMSMVDCSSTADPDIDLHKGTSTVELIGTPSKRPASGVRKRNHRVASRHTVTSTPSEAGVLHSSQARDGRVDSAFASMNRDQEPVRASLRGRNECATNMWERALRRARDDPSFGTLGQSLGGSFGQFRRNHSLDRRPSRRQTSHHHNIASFNTLPARESRSLSPHIGASTRSNRGSFNLDKHQLLCAEARRPLTRSTSIAGSIKTHKRSLLDIRRFTKAGNQSNYRTANPPPGTATFPRDFLAWARFPSHTRNDRNGPASDKDGVLTRDFIPPTDSVVSSSKNYSKLSLMTQPGDFGVHTPGSWRFLKLGHAKKRSRSMNFAIDNPTSTEQQKGGVKKKSSLMTLTLSLKRLKRLYHSHSSDLRRFRAGHRSSVSKGGSVEFPELEIVPGYDGGTWSGGKARMEQLGDFQMESRRWMKERERRLMKGNVDESSKKKKMSGNVFSGVHATEASMKTEAGKVVDGGWISPSSSVIQQTPTKYRCGATTMAGSGQEGWAEIYQNCVVRDHDDSRGDDDRKSEQLRFAPASSVRLLQHDPRIDNYCNAICRSSESAIDEDDDSYVSCSIGPSDGLNEQHSLHRAAGLNVDGSYDLRSSDRLPAEKDEAHYQGEGIKRLLSSELRDSTTDFRTQLEGEERRAREALLSRVMDGGGEAGISQVVKDDHER